MTRWSTNLETELLKRYAKNAQYGIVEIGVFDGENTAEMATVATVPIYGIDPIIPDSMGKDLGSEHKIISNMEFYDKFIFLKDYSYNVVKKFQYKFDMIFIDGSHLYEDVLLDYYDWYPKLEVGGFILFHDSAPVTSIHPSPFNGWPGPTKFVEELIKIGKKRIEICDTISVFRKDD